MIHLQPPSPLPHSPAGPTLFLAGSIDNSAAERWQERFVQALSHRTGTIFNPRREQWDPTWEQRLHHPQFREQVEWELAALERSDVIAMYFAPASIAPITLLELGLFARSGKLIIGCPDPYWRKGNVEVVAARYDIPLLDTFDGLLSAASQKLASIQSGRSGG